MPTVWMNFSIGSIFYCRVLSILCYCISHHSTNHITTTFYSGIKFSYGSVFSLVPKRYFKVDPSLIQVTPKSTINRLLVNLKEKLVITGINITSAPDIIEDVTIQGYRIQTTGCFDLVTDEYLPKASNIYLGFNFWSLV